VNDMATTPHPGIGGIDYRGTEAEGVIIRTIDSEGNFTEQSNEITIGYRNYGAARTAALTATHESRLRGSRDYWLAMEASEAVTRFVEVGLEVPEELKACIG